MSQIDLKLVIALARVNNTLFSAIERSLKKEQLSTSEFGVLELIYHKGSQPVQEIAKKILVTSGTITYVIDKLIQKGLVTRKNCESDKRRYYIDLTESGKEVIEALFPKHQAYLEEIFSGLDEASKEVLVKTLFELLDTMS